MISKKSVSSSGMLWSGDYNEKSEFVVTSSSTGKLNRFNLRDINSEVHQVDSIPSTFGTIIPSKVKFLSNGVLVVLDNRMNIHYKVVSSSSWESIQAKNQMKIVSMESHGERIYAISTDSLTIFQFDNECGQLKHHMTLEIPTMLNEELKLDYLRSIHVMSDDEVCVCDASGLFISLSLSDGGRIMRTFQIPKSLEPWSKAAVRVGDCWLIGDRNGNVHLFNASMQPTCKLSKVHGNTLSSMRALDNDYIETTGVDGCIRTIRVQHEIPSLVIYATERTSVGGIEKIVRWQDKEYVLGFNDDFFVIYERKGRRVVYERRCGGKHRCWDISEPDENGKMRFAYINKRELNLVEFALVDTSFDVVNKSASWHILDCNVMQRIGNILVTGGEDTMMKIFKVEDGSEEIEEITSVCSHNSSIKSLKLVKCDEDILIISAGGRAQIAINRLINSKQIKEEINYKLTNNNGKVNKGNFDPETRITDIYYNNSTRILYVTCSDGFIRIFECSNGSLRMTTEHFYGRCLQKVLILDKFIITMATDGFICFWQHDTKAAKLILSAKLKHNQSGINCFDILSNSNDKHTIATAGDDNEIFITTFTIDNDMIRFDETISNNSIHIAQITGIKFTSETELHSTSIDQTLCKLKIKSSRIEPVERQFTCVADVKGLLQLHDGRFVIYSAGMEII